MSAATNPPCRVCDDRPVTVEVGGRVLMCRECADEFGPLMVGDEAR